MLNDVVYQRCSQSWHRVGQHLLGSTLRFRAVCNFLEVDSTHQYSPIGDAGELTAVSRIRYCIRGTRQIQRSSSPASQTNEGHRYVPRPLTDPKCVTFWVQCARSSILSCSFTSYSDIARLPVTTLQSSVQKTIVKAQTIMTTVKRLSVALRDTAHVCHHTIKRLWVRGSHLLLRLVQWSAVLCLTAMFAAVLYPMACVGIITALAFACLEMRWLFWLLRLDVASIAAVGGAWCQRIFRSVKAGPSKIWSAIQALSAFHIGICFLNRLVDGRSIFKSHIKSCFSKATAYTTQTMLYAMRKFIVLTW